jgi:plastocyanin
MPIRPLAVTTAAALSLLASGHALGQASVPTATWDQAAQAQVVLSNFSFTPATLHFREGEPLRLTVRSEGGGHNFSAPAFFAAARIAPEDAAKIDRGGIAVTSGQSVTVRLIPASGNYRLTCIHFGHGLMGMKGNIVVS